jgi:hypothetical protein
MSETWSLILSEEYGLRTFENRVLRRLYGNKIEVAGGWTKFNNEELFNVFARYCYGDQIKYDELSRLCNKHG